MFRILHILQMLKVGTVQFAFNQYRDKINKKTLKWNMNTDIMNTHTVLNWILNRISRDASVLVITEFCIHFKSFKIICSITRYVFAARLWKKYSHICKMFGKQFIQLDSSQSFFVFEILLTITFSTKSYFKFSKFSMR